jgi:hypothetical protein
MSDPRVADRRIDAQYRFPAEYSNTIGADCDQSCTGTRGRKPSHLAGLRG